MALDYQTQESDQTPAEALDEYYRANVGNVPPPGELPPESRALFRNHDLCHVIFGLGTTLDDEVMVDARTMLSCDVGIERAPGPPSSPIRTVPCPSSGTMMSLE
jgi:hypothetical protein